MLLFNPKIELVVYAGGQKVTIRDLHIDYMVEMEFGGGKKPEPNTAEITIYNLSAATRGLFGEEHQGVELWGGYGDDLSVIFSGYTANVISTPDSTEWRTTIYAGDGIKELETRNFCKSYSAGVSVAQIIKEVCAAITLPVSIDPMDEVKLLRGESYCGRAKDVLTQITTDRGLEWSVQYGVVTVHQVGLPPFRGNQAAILSSETGMLGYPSVVDWTDSNNKKKKKYGVTVRTLLLPQIRPGGLITIKAEKQTSALGDLMKDKVANVDANGTYLVKRVSHYGDAQSREYTMELEADQYAQ